MEAAIFRKVPRAGVEARYLEVAKALQPVVQQEMRRFGIAEIAFLARNEQPGDWSERKLWCVERRFETQRTFTQNAAEILKEFEKLMLDLFDKIMLDAERQGKYFVFIQAEQFNHFTLRLNLNDGEDIYFIVGSVFEASV